MMGREVNSIATAREKCRQLLWQAALQLYVELVAVGRWLSVRPSVRLSVRSCCHSHSSLIWNEVMPQLKK